MTRKEKELCAKIVENAINKNPAEVEKLTRSAISLKVQDILEKKKKEMLGKI